MGTMEKKLAHDLASVGLRLRSEAREAANQALTKQCLIDAVAAALAGYDSSAAEIAERFAIAGLGTGNLSPWFSSVANITPIGTAFVNSAAMSSLDIDDGNRAACGHLGAAVVPAASAFGSLSDVSAETFGHAVLAGCEIGARLGAAESPPFFASGRWAGVGAAVATGICLGFDEETLANAISLSVHAAPIMGAARLRAQMTGHIKEGVPLGLLSGVTSALLAEQGFRGDPDAVESVGIYDIAKLVGHPRGTFAFKRTYFKRYTCCRLAHAPIDAAVAIAERERLDVRDIAAVTVRTFRAAIELPNEARPTSFESAQYSVPFALAVALVNGKDALLPLLRRTLQDRDIVALAGRVVLEYDERLNELYPSSTPTQVQIDTYDGRTFREERDTADGDPGRPFTDEQLLEKLRTLGRGKIPATQLASIVAVVQAGIPSARDFEATLRI
jgi:2-methylcitrate dehydratase PrpD